MISVKFLGKYYLQEKVASSLISNLFRAMEIGSNGFERMVALHRLGDELIRDDAKRGALAETVARLHPLVHPNLVRLLELGNVREDWFLVREWVHGTSLRVVLSRMLQTKQSFSLEESLFLARELLQALDAIELFAEEHNLPALVHGQIHPNNVLISYTGEVKLIGLGLSELYRTREIGPLDLDGLPYRSPEELSGKPLDARADVFSVGTVLFEALTSKPLWLGKDNNETISRIQTGLAVHQAVERGLTREVAGFVCKAVEPRRDWRFLGAADAIDSLAALAPRLQPAECRKRLSHRLHGLFEADLEREHAKVLEEHRTLAKLLGTEPPPEDELYGRRGAVRPGAGAEGEPETAVPTGGSEPGRRTQRTRPEAAGEGRSAEAELAGTHDLIPGSTGGADGITTGRALESLVFEEAPPVSGTASAEETGGDPYGAGSASGDIVLSDALSSLVGDRTLRPYAVTRPRHSRDRRHKDPEDAPPADAAPISLVYNDEMPPPPPAPTKRGARGTQEHPTPAEAPVPLLDAPIGELVPLGGSKPSPEAAPEPGEPERISPPSRPAFGMSRSAASDKTPAKKEPLSLHKPQVSREQWRRSLEQLGSTAPPAGMSPRTRQILWLVAIAILAAGLLLFLQF